MPEITNGPRLVVFDLDGTLLPHVQSQRLLLAYMRERGEIGAISYVKILFWFACYKLGIVSRPENVMNYAYSFLQGKSVVEFDRTVSCFFHESLRQMFPDSAKNIIKQHRDSGDCLVLVSNSIQPVVKVVAVYLGIADHISTELAAHQGQLVGSINGNCIYGQYKALVVQKYAAEKQLQLVDSIAYADHISDLQLLEMVAHPVAVNPCHKLRNVARTRRWQVIST